MRTRHLVFTALLLTVPRVALACPVCFGQSDSPLASAMNLGILAMLGIIVAVLGGFATFIVHLVRRERLVAQATDAADAARFRISGDAQEGAVQC